MVPMTLASNFPDAIIDEIVPLTAVTVGGVVIVVWVIAATIDSVVKNRSRERTRREVAAYVAEGSMSPSDGERLLKAEPPKDA